MQTPLHQVIKILLLDISKAQDEKQYETVKILKNYLNIIYDQMLEIEEMQFKNAYEVGSMEAHFPSKIREQLNADVYYLKTYKNCAT